MRPGIYRRRIRIEAGTDSVRVDLEDDPHRHSVLVRHDGERVTAVEARAIRVPWTLCRSAVSVLDRLVGMPLGGDLLQAGRYTNSLQQCTHLFDMAGLAAAYALRGIASRQYDIEAPYWQPEGPRTLRLSRDGVPVLEWLLDGDTLQAPEKFAGRDIRRLLRWAGEAISDRDEFEAVVLLRRTVLISTSRLHDGTVFDNATESNYKMGACFVYQPGMVEQAHGMPDALKDFTTDAGLLLSDINTINFR